jgi:hypothetical protein
VASRFDDFADVKLGYKSFLNDFFYITASVVERFEIEDDFLVPAYMVDDLDADSYFQTPTPRRWLFWCKLEPTDLRGTGAGKYIKWGSRQETNTRKQTKEAVTWPEAPALQHQKHWYWPPAPMHPTKVAVRKGMGTRYAPFLFRQPVVLDQRLYLLFPRDGVPTDLLAAYLSSSFFPLSLETNADLGLGAGVLTLGTDALRSLPSIDLAAVTASSARPKVLRASRSLFRSKPVDAPAYPTTSLLTSLDEAFIETLGLKGLGPTDAANEVVRLADVRYRMASLRKVAKASASSHDVTEVASAVAEGLASWLSARRFPEDSFSDHAALVFTLPSTITVSISTLLDLSHIRIGDPLDNTFYEADVHPTVAEVLLRALQMGRRQFKAPSGGPEASKTLDGLSELLDEFEDEFRERTASMSLGPKYESSVLREVLKKVRMPLRELRLPFQDGHWTLGEES